MRRTARTRDLPHPPPVEKIELNENDRRGRLIAAVLFLAIGAVALAYGFFTLVTGESGWREIEAASSDGPSVAADFVLSYDLGAAGVAASNENRALTALYGQAARKAYQLFDTAEGYEGMNNLYTLNNRPNEELEVDPVLYRAFSLLEAEGRRELYLGPLYAANASLCLAQDDAYARELDPWLNGEQAAYFARVAAFARDPAAVDLELLGEDRVRLSVSDEYLRFAEENELDRFIDFAWMKNAFITDFLAETLAAEGYTLGVLSSVDGFSRNLGQSGISYSLNIYDKAPDGVRQAAVMDYDAALSTVSLRAYPASANDALRFYRYQDGSIRSPYLDLADGRCKSALDDLTAYSARCGCGEILLKLLPVFVADSFDEAALTALGREDIQSVWCSGGVLYHTDRSLELRELYQGYTSELVS